MNNQLYKDIIRHIFCKGENDMANYYRVAYKESKNTLKQICELFRVDSSDITIKFIVTVMGPLVFYFMCKYGNPGGGTPGGMTFFVIKFIVVWALAFVAAVILNRTIWRKVLSTTAVGDAEEQFDRRCRLNGGPVSSEIHFFDDHFDSVTAKKTRSFSYKDVTKILETKEAFGVVVKADPETVGSARAMIGFSKDCTGRKQYGRTGRIFFWKDAGI